MKHLLLTTIAAVVLVGCGESQQSAPAPEAKPVEPVAEAAQPKPPTAKAPVYDIGMSARLGKIEAVKQHLAAGTDVDAKGMTGWTPLHMAAMSGRKEIAELLIAKGADVNAENNLHKTPLDLAEDEIADLIRKHGGKRGAAVSIHAAAVVGNIEAVKQHLAAGADVNAKDNVGKTPLDWAIRFQLTELADLLRKHGGKTGEELEAAGK